METHFTIYNLYYIQNKFPKKYIKIIFKIINILNYIIKVLI
jgi:hypothetical protein